MELVLHLLHMHRCRRRKWHLHLPRCSWLRRSEGFRQAAEGCRWVVLALPKGEELMAAASAAATVAAGLLVVELSSQATPKPQRGCSDQSLPQTQDENRRHTMTTIMVGDFRMVRAMLTGRYRRCLGWWRSCRRRTKGCRTWCHRRTAIHSRSLRLRSELSFAL